jgi:hypothetical protein
VLQIINAKPFSLRVLNGAKETNLWLLKSTMTVDIMACTVALRDLSFQKSIHLGASPDAVVHDPSVEAPFGLVEVKCPYSFRHETPLEAAKSPNFFCSVDQESGLKLKRTHK